jgi:hypothetical protein
MALQYEYGAHKVWKLKDAIWLHVKHCLCYLTECFCISFFFFILFLQAGFGFLFNMQFWCSVSYLDHDCYIVASALVVSLFSLLSSPRDGVDPALSYI